jgi:hypothetical protein
MSYQALAQPTANTTAHTIVHNGLSAVKSFFVSLGVAMMENSAGARRLNHIKALQSKSDAQLAAMGLKRDEIVHHVFRDLYYV